MHTPPAPTIRRASSPADWADAAHLIGEHLRWIDRHTPIDLGRAQPAAGGECTDPSSVFAGAGSALLIGRIGRLGAGVLGVRPCPFEPGAAELTRFFVRPVARSNGLGRALLEAALDEAERLGYGRVVLETLPSHMAAAVRLYEAAGFTLEPSGSRHGIPGAVRYAMDVVDRPALAG